MTHEEIRNLRQKWNDIITNYPNDLFNSITGKRWTEVYVDFKEYKKSILEATIPGNIPVHNELSQLKHAVAILTDFFNKTDERIKILRIKNTQVVDEIIQSIIADGEKNYNAITLAKEEFYATTASNYSIVFSTERPILECLNSLDSWDLSSVEDEIAEDLKKLIEKAKLTLDANV